MNQTYQSISNDGSHRTRDGNITINKRVKTFATRKGRAPRNMMPILRPETAEHTLRQLPTGGVHAPTASPITSITPNNMGDPPAEIIIGKKIGVNKSIAGLTSINVPANRIINIISINSQKSDRSNPSTEYAKSSGNLSYARIQMNNLENAIMIMILALVRIE